MMKIYLYLLPVFITAIFFSGCAAKVEKKDTETLPAVKEIKEDVAELLKTMPPANAIALPPFTKMDSISIDDNRKTVELTFSKDFSYNAFREDNVEFLYSAVKEVLGSKYDDYKLTIKTLNKPVEELIPNYYRSSKDKYDVTRLSRTDVQRPASVVKNTSKQLSITNGLQDKNIVLWHSHGWYFDPGNKRWEWQRPRLFQTVEDLIPLQFTLPYIIPMLENAGANVFVPRERDVQINEIIVDNDGDRRSYQESSSGEAWVTRTPGFLSGNIPYPEKYNPFLNGTTRSISAANGESATVSWIPDIPETGYYAVYVSYAASPENVSDAHYTVYHSGQITEFTVNQKIGGNTWIYLGHFKFSKGFNELTDKVVLSNRSTEPGKLVSADAVKFGGGMGDVSRNGSTSGRPKYVEGSRYYLQSAGMPDTLVYDLNEGLNDYNDDYQSRGEYVNYLMGAPKGPKRNRNSGLGIPIDLSMAFHTDAGITFNDTTIGTLAIYTIDDVTKKPVFPDGVSRYANRDLSDIIQTQITEDIRKTFDPVWSRRQLRESEYSESTRPNTPSILLELLSHQNFLDMKFVLDPRFRFQVARSIYKGMLKFLATQFRVPYVVQPLPVDHFQAILDAQGQVKLSWKPVSDKLEPSAEAASYMVYTRIDEGDFDNGRLSLTNEIVFNDLQPGKIYSYKVTALNAGGESFPSEILSVSRMNNLKPPALIINGFDRISGPAAVETPGFMGFANFIDAGVPDKFDYGFTGTQYNFDPASEFITNEAPGHGASRADFETKVIAGNSFDYPYIHGLSLKNNGISFSSSSDEAVWSGAVNISGYKFVDLILGEEKETRWPKKAMDSLYGLQYRAFPAELKNVITQYCSSGGNLFVSGAYVGSDLVRYGKADSLDVQFAKRVLKFNWLSDHASTSGKVLSVSNSFFGEPVYLTYNTELNDKIYAVEAPDAIGPTVGSKPILRYDDNRFSAGVAYKQEYGVVTFGFPFETINGQAARDRIMKSILKYFKVD